MVGLLSQYLHTLKNEYCKDLILSKKDEQRVCARMRKGLSM